MFHKMGGNFESDLTGYYHRFRNLHFISADINGQILFGIEIIDCHQPIICAYFWIELYKKTIFILAKNNY